MDKRKWNINYKKFLFELKKLQLEGKFMIELVIHVWKSNYTFKSSKEGLKTWCCIFALDDMIRYQNLVLLGESLLSRQQF